MMKNHMMKIKSQDAKTIVLSSAFLVLYTLFSLFNPAHAQTYKWVDANGKIVYSDTPPPKNAKKLGAKSGDISGAASSVQLPAELAAAVNKNPVVFYAAPSCEACDEARTMLKKAGIPFTEKTIKTTADIEKLKEISGDTQLPLMTISRSKFWGFEPDGWRKALSAAGYPENNMLPKDYRNPEPQAAAPQVAQKDSKENKEKPPEALKPRTTSPTGIRF